MYRFATDTSQACVNGTHQSNTVSLIRSHMDGNYRWGKIFPFSHLWNKKKNPTYKETALQLIVITLTWRLSSWFHSGFAFFSIIFVHSYGKTSRTKTHYTQSSNLRVKFDAIPSSRRTRPRRMDLRDSFCCFLLQMLPSKTEWWSHPLKVWNISEEGFNKHWSDWWVKECHSVSIYSKIPPPQ